MGEGFFSRDCGIRMTSEGFSMTLRRAFYLPVRSSAKRPATASQLKYFW